MPTCQLRIYNGPCTEENTSTEPESARSQRCMKLPAGEILPLLAEAMAEGRTWLRDFEDDEMTISVDLYEVLLAYQHYRRPVA